MTRQAIIYILILLVGLAGGTGIGVLVTKSKIDDTQAALAEVQAELADVQAQQNQSNEKTKTAAAEISRLKTDLVNSRNDVMRKNAELLRAQTDLAKMKSLLQQTLGQGATEATTETAVTPTSTTPMTRTTTSTTPAGTGTTRTALTSTATTGGVREYTIKEGDSFWKIAANELGNGTRYTEILKLNPTLNKDSILPVGMKIKLPAK